MGRLRYFLFSFSKIFPKKYRKPFFLISSILGLMIFMRFMIQMTGSLYLIAVQSSINDLLDIFLIYKALPAAVIFVCLLMVWLSYRYYKSLQTAISIGYLIILILAFLPMLLGH